VCLDARPDRGAYRVDTDAGCLFVKHYTPQGLRARIRDFALRRKPQRALELGRLLRESGISTPPPVGLFALGLGLWQEALLVSRWVGPTRKWSEYLVGDARRDRDADRFRASLSQLAILLGRLHRLGFYHGDLSGNLVFDQGDPESRAYIVDLEDLHRRLSRKRRIKNLEELGRGLPDLSRATLRDRWLFLREYARAAGLDDAGARSLWREGRAAQLWRKRRHARKSKRGE